MATAAFRIGHRLYSCLALIDGAFALDALHRRGGTLVHLLATEVKEGQDLGLHGAALVEQALVMRRPEVGNEHRLRAYLLELSDLTTIDVRPPSLEAFRVLGLEFLFAFFEAAAATLPPARPPEPIPIQAPVAAMAHHPAEALAAASGALPPRLRLAMRWGFGLSSGSGMQILVCWKSRTPRELRRSDSNRSAGIYAQWLMNSIRAGRLEEIRQVISDWDIRSWADLTQTIAAKR
jgi:hypothetical protein